MAAADSGKGKTAAMARGAGLAFLGRAGAVIEVFTFFLFTQMYGSETFGLFMTLWGLAQVLSIISDFGMTMALQRFVPAEDDERGAGRVLKYAFYTALTISCVMAGALVLAAPWLADVINANERDSQHLVTIIQVYAIAIPLWCLIDVATAAIRARSIFGPEVRVRVFYEQGFRLMFGSLFWYLGAVTMGLFISHLIGLAVTLVFALRLLHKYYGLHHLFARTGMGKGLGRQMMSFSSSMMLPNLAKKWHSWLPVLFLNIMLPGARGAEAAGVYSAARKLVSVLNIFRESFEYVLAPMASAQKADKDRGHLQEMYAFATRMSVAAFIPTATLIICYRDELLRQSGSEFVAGAAAMLVLALGRSVEVTMGPSTSILAMIGAYRLPLINAVAGVLTTAICAYILVPQPELFGGGLAGSMVGAAIAAAAGINVTALLGHLQVRFIYNLQPFDLRMVRPVVVSLLVGAVLAGLYTATQDIWRTGYFLLGITTLLLALMAIIRLGMTAEDARLIVPRALGKRFPFLIQR
ncbi:MAG: lipopolysaccharide biosynthesis protein [Alphaproteobacteria bacterium]